MRPRILAEVTVPCSTPIRLLLVLLCGLKFLYSYLSIQQWYRVIINWWIFQSTTTKTMQRLCANWSSAEVVWLMASHAERGSNGGGWGQHPIMNYRSSPLYIGGFFLLLLRIMMKAEPLWHQTTIKFQQCANLCYSSTRRICTALEAHPVSSHKLTVCTPNNVRGDWNCHEHWLGTWLSWSLMLILIFFK